MDIMTPYNRLDGTSSGPDDYDQKEAKRLDPLIRASRDDKWGMLRAFGRGVVGDATYGVSDLTEMGAAAAVSNDLSKAAIKADEIRADELAYPVASAAGSFLLPAASIIGGLVSGGLLPLAAAGASAVGSLGKKLLRRKAAKTIEGRVVSRIASEAGQELSQRLVAQAGQEALELGSKDLLTELAQESGQKLLEQAASEVVEKQVERKARSITIDKIGRVVSAPFKAASKAYSYTPGGAADALGDLVNKKVQDGLRKRVFKAAPEVTSNAGRSVLRELGEGIAVKLPARAASALVELPLYSLGAAARESALSMDFNAGAEYLSSNVVNNFLSGGEMYGYFGLAEAALPASLKLAGKALGVTADYLPIFGRLKKVDLWTSDGAVKQTGVLPTTSEWMFDNKEMLSDAAELWDDAKYGSLFDTIRGLDPRDAEYFVRNHSQILEAASKLPDTQSREFVSRLRLLSDSQRGFLINNMDLISDIESAKPGFSRAIGKMIDGQNGALELDSAQEILHAARDASLSSVSVLDVSKNLFARKTEQVATTGDLLRLAFDRMSKDVGDIVSSFGQPGGPASAGVVIDGAHDLADSIKAAIASAKEHSKSTGLKYSKNVLSKLESAVSDYQESLESLVGKDSRKPVSVDDLVAEQTQMYKKKMDALARGQPDPTPEGYSFDAMMNRMFGGDDVIDTANPLAAASSDLAPSTKVNGAFIDAVNANKGAVETAASVAEASAERTLDAKTAQKIHELQRNFRSVIGEVVSYGRSSTYGAKPQFTKRFVRATGLADVIYGFARSTLQDPKIWGEAGAARGAIDNVYSRYMTETGNNGLFRKNFMKKTMRSSTSKKVRYEVDFDLVAKFVSNLGKTVNEEADAMVRQTLSRVEDITGQKIHYSPLASPFDSWNNMNQIMKDSVDVVTRYLPDLLDQTDPKFVNALGTSRVATGDQTAEFLNVLSEINNRVVSESNFATSRMRSSERIDKLIDDSKKYLDQDRLVDLDPQGMPKGSLGPDLKPISPSSVLGPFNPFYAVSQAYRVIDAANKGLRSRWQVASQLKSMVQADRVANAIRKGINQKAETLFRLGSRASSDPRIMQLLRIAKKQHAGEMLTEDERLAFEQQNEIFKDIIADENEGEPGSATGRGQSSGDSEQDQQDRFNEIISNDEDIAPSDTPTGVSDQPRINQDMPEGKEQAPKSISPSAPSLSDEDVVRIIKSSRDLSSNDDMLMGRMQESAGEVMGSLPQTISSASSVMRRVSSEIARVAPRKPTTILGKEQFNEQQVERVKRIMEIASNPHSIIDGVMDGSLTGDDVDSLDRIYPSTSMEIKLAVQQTMQRFSDEGIDVPFPIQYAAEKLLGVPVTASASAAVARSAQGVYSQGKQRGPGRPRETMTPAMVANRSSGRVYGASNLGMANRLLTDKQRSETRNA